ncbi:MAG: hypothetical protein HY816_21455 [Candidatus Wallbacteria bacterium]|nr:hypothetical protein [Candidatus Wallbacteria bacterium]
MPDEISQKHIRQDYPGLRKRWFQGDSCDLALWQDGTGKVVRYQLLLDPDLVIDYETGRGMLTGRADRGRGVGHHLASALIQAEASLNLSTLKLAFREFCEHPPLAQKRVLKLVAETLDAALTNPEAPQYPDGTLPPGHDSALMDVRKLQDSLQALKEAKEREGIISRLLSRFMGGR